jgi:hypothetical protein
MKNLLAGLMILAPLAANADCSISIRGISHLSSAEQAAIEAVLIEDKNYTEVKSFNLESGLDTDHLLEVSQFGAFEFQRKEQIALRSSTKLIYKNEKTVLLRDEAKVIIKLINKMPACK